MGPVFDEQQVQERVIDEKLWRANCLDLKRVMSVAKSVFLLLEHSNEACVRLGVELVTDPKARKTLWWNDSWFADEKKFDHFKALVRKKLELILCSVKGVPLSQLEGDDDEDAVDQNEFEELKRKLAESEAAAKAAKLQQANLERQFAAAEAAAQEAKDQAAALTKSLDEMRKKVREAEEAASVAQKEAAAARSEAEAAIAAGAARLAEAEAAAAAAKKPQPVAAPPPVKQEPEKPPPKEVPVKQVVGSSPEDKKRIAELERALKKGEEEREALRKQLREASEQAARASKELQSRKSSAKVEVVEETPVAAPPPKPEPPVKEEEFNKVMEKLQEERKVSKGLQQEVDRHKAQIEELKKKLAQVEDRASTAEKLVNGYKDRIKVLEEQLKSAGQTPPAPPPKKTEPAVELDVERARSKHDDDAELQMLRQRASLVDGLQEKVKVKDDTIARLKEEMRQLEEQKLRMAKQLAQVRDQLRRVTEIAEKKGLGNIVKEIMDEAEVLETVNSAEYTCFARLWEDALRRQRKQNMVEAARFGGGAGAVMEEERPHVATFLKRGRRASAMPAMSGGGRDDALDFESMLGMGRSGSHSPGLYGSLAEEGGESGDGGEGGGGRGSYKAGYDAGYRAGYEAAMRGGGHGDLEHDRIYGNLGAGESGLLQIVGNSYFPSEGAGRRPSVAPHLLGAGHHVGSRPTTPTGGHGGGGGADPRGHNAGRSPHGDGEAMGKRLSNISNISGVSGGGYGGGVSAAGLGGHDAGYGGARRPSVAGGGGGAFRGLVQPDLGTGGSNARESSPVESRPASRERLPHSNSPRRLMESSPSSRAEMHDAPPLLPPPPPPPQPTAASGGLSPTLHGSASSPLLRGGATTGLRRATSSFMVQSGAGAGSGISFLDPMVRGTSLGGSSRMSTVGFAVGPTKSMPPGLGASGASPKLGRARSQTVLLQPKPMGDGLPQIGGAEIGRRRALLEAGEGSRRGFTTQFSEQDVGGVDGGGSPMTAMNSGPRGSMFVTERERLGSSSRSGVSPRTHWRPNRRPTGSRGEYDRRNVVDTAGEVSP